MRTVSQEFQAAVLGSNTPVVTVDIWSGGEVVRANAKVMAGEVEFDSSRAIEGRLSLVVLDDESEGSRLSQVIHSIGMQANIRAGFDMAGLVETVSLGWYDIHDTKSFDAWEWYDWNLGDDGKPIGTKTSSVVTIDGLDYLSVVAASPFLVPQQPVAGSDAWATIAGLCTGIVSVLDPGYAAKTIPTGLVFEWDRLKAIQAIAELWDAFPVMNNDGQLTLATEASGDAVGDFGVKVNIAAWQDSTSSTNLHNGATVLGKSPEGTELIGTATETSGPAAWGGSFGYRPTRRTSEIMTTQAMVDAAAKADLAAEIASRAVVQTVDALWNPAVELRDRPKLTLPDRSPATKVLGYSIPLKGGAMSLTLRLPVTL